jgi:hypothetical protein
MSARAASRLETLGFRQVYRYQPGKADWFAAGLPREGHEAHTPRVAEIARRDVPTCRIDERVGAVRDRLREGGWDVCIVVGTRASEIFSTALGALAKLTAVWRILVFGLRPTRRSHPPPPRPWMTLGKPSTTLLPSKTPPSTFCQPGGHWPRLPPTETGPRGQVWARPHLGLTCSF